MSLLHNIQTTAQQMAEVITNVLDMTVTIVDDNMVRIAGTGYHRTTIGQQITENSLYKKVIQNAQEYIITDVSTHTDCSTCSGKANCKELAQLCCPVVADNHVIGVIGLIAFLPEQQLEINRKNERLLAFIRKIGQMLALKAVEKNNLERLTVVENQLETIVNCTAEGIVVIDNAAKVTTLNLAAEKMLGIKEYEAIGTNIDELLPGMLLSEVLQNGKAFTNRLITLPVKRHQNRFFINAKPVVVDGAIQGVIANFRAIDASQSHSGSGGCTTFDDIIGNSKELITIKKEARKAAETSSTVLICGESGTGKELFARAIHNASSRRQSPFVAINCAAIPDTLLESELFGYEEGAFTGARKGGKLGKFQLANGGTIFLDEIGDMPLLLQAKLLRVLQEKVLERLGSIKTIPIDVRVIAATNRNLEELIEKGKFREDLYYRLSVFPLLLPPLRGRTNDILDLAEYFLNKHTLAYANGKKSYTPEAIAMLQQYSWPGNIRELENAIEYMVIKADGPSIETKDLPSKICAKNSKCKQCSEALEKQAIIKALEACGTTVEDKKRAAESLGMGIATLYRKMRKYNI